MLCRNPFIKGRAAHGCGQCLPCRIQRRRLWTHRILLESLQHSDNAFVTLTYAQEERQHSLEPADLRNWLKRLRKNLEPLRIRYYAVGEYGDQSQHAHFHAVLFGYPWCECYLYNKGRPTDRWRQCDTCRLIHETWQNGIVHVARLEESSAQYVAQYTTKKLTHRLDPRLHGRHPEFARMSTSPGIGHGALEEIARAFTEFNLVDREADVPSALRHGKRLMPLGRYLRRALREKLWGCPDAPIETIAAAEAALHDLYETACSITPDKKLQALNYKNLIIEAADQAVRNMEARQQLRKQTRTI